MSQRCQQRKSALIFDHLVSAGEQRRWHGKAERLGRFEVDDQLELGRTLDGQIRRPGVIKKLHNELPGETSKPNPVRTAGRRTAPTPEIKSERIYSRLPFAHRFSQPPFHEDGTIQPNTLLSSAGARLGCCSPVPKATCGSTGACTYLACAILTRSRCCLEARRT